MIRKTCALLFAACTAAVHSYASDLPPQILSLVAVEVRYAEDGAADASVTESLTPELQSLADLDQEAIPLLIRCLNSRAATRAVAVTYQQSRERVTAVPLGYLCLDVLMAITHGKIAHVHDCTDDGFGACMNASFYFRPDVYSRHNESEASTEVTAVQKAWQKALERGEITFIYPSWWQK